GTDEPDLPRLGGAEPVREGARGQAHGLEARVEVARDQGRESGADPADVPQCAAVVDAEGERADRVVRGSGGHEARDDELLPRRTLRLGPALAAPRPIGRTPELRHDAFEAEPAGVPEHDLAVLVEMAAVAQRSGAVAEDRLQKPLALDKRRLAQIEAVQVEEIEGVEDEAVRALLAEGPLEGGEVRRAGVVLDHDLAVDQRLAHGKPLERLDHRLAELRRPVEPAAREQREASLVDARLDPIAVELDFVQPAFAGGRRLDRRRQHRLDEAGQRRPLRPLDRRQIRQFGGVAAPLDPAGLRRPARRLLRHLVDGASGRRGIRPLLQNVRRVLASGEFVVALDEQPVLVLVARLAPHPDEMPAALQLLAIELELEMALGESLVRIVDRLPGPAVPDENRAAAVLALRDRSLERPVFERMVLDHHRKPLLAGHEARAARHRPAFQDAVEFEAKVVMEAPRVVFLDDEAVSFSGSGRGRPRFRSGLEIALGAILLERHLNPLSGAVSPGRAAAAALFRSSRRFRAARPWGRSAWCASAASAPRSCGPRSW